MRIEIDGVTKRYGDVTALDDVSFAVETGETFGLVGTNGAGKTTLFKLLVGHDRPSSGRIRVGDTDAAEAGRRVRELVGFLPQIIGFPPRLTGREVLAFTARARGVSASDRSARIAEVLETVGLTGAADRTVDGYSGGMGRRLGLAVATLANPPVLVLDEPTAGLDPEGVAEFHRVIERIRTDSDATVIFSSHVLSEVETLCDGVAILHDGRLRAVGPVADLTRRTSDGAIVRFHAEETEAVAPVASGFGDLELDGRVVTVTTRDDDVIDLLDAVDAVASIDSIEVRRPGLESVFSEAIARAADPDGGPTIGSPAGRSTDRPCTRVGSEGARR